jgi:hypothetical protein
MRITVLPAMTCIVLALASQGGTAAQPTSDRAADVTAIRKHIESICQAFVDKDRNKLEDTHGKDWRGFTPWSDHVIRGREGYMNEATFAPGTPKGEGIVGYRIADFDVVFYGDSAVASFILEVDRVQGTEKSKQLLTLVDVYHKGSGGWIQVASNTSFHPSEIDRQMSQPRRLGDAERADVLAAREAVWRAWFAGDTVRLANLVPPELITLEDSDQFGSRASTIEGSRGFAASGGKLTRLVFPRTEFQAYGQTVILYTTYEMDVTTGGKTQTDRGVATEVFVRQNGQWLNTGWQLARRASSEPR